MWLHGMVLSGAGLILKAHEMGLGVEGMLEGIALSKPGVVRGSLRILKLFWKVN